MKKVLLSVIIPNYNGRELLIDCLGSLAKQTYENFEIILVDNGSTDNSIEYVTDNFPEIKIIKLNKNFGFTKAINKGVLKSICKYIVLLNNDTEVDKDWLKNLVQCADKHPEVISINSKLLNFYNRKILDGAGILINEVGQAKSIGWQEKDFGKYDKETYIFGATGGGSLFRREEFIKVGLFDEQFFMYSEEVDFAFRAQFFGYKSIFCPSAIIYHKHKATAGKKPQLVEYWQFRNMTMVIIKDFPIGLLIKKWRWLKIILVHMNTIFYQIRNGFLWAPFLADCWIIIHLIPLLKQRTKIQKKINVSSEYIESFLQDKKITFWGLR